MSYFPIFRLNGKSNPKIKGQNLIIIFSNTVKLGNKERLDKEQIGIKELFMDYQPFYAINLLLDKELLPV